MLHFLDPLRGVDGLSVILKLTVAVVIGAAIGLERSHKNKPAGVRTHMLVATGAAVASLTGQFIHLGMSMPTDVTRISAAVISGLSFLGVGTIIVTRSYSVKGLTTAAGLWATGIVGIAAGLGFYEGAVITGVLVLISELSADFFRSRMRHDAVYNVEVLSTNKDPMADVMRSLKNRNVSISSLRMVSTEVDGEQYYLSNLHLKIGASVDRKKLYDDMAATDGVVQVLEIEQLS